MYNKNWINSGIVFVRDILDVHGRIMKEGEIIKRLKNRSNWIADYCMIKKACKVVEGLSRKLEFANVKISDHAVIYTKNKNWDVLYQKAGFYYKILRDQNYQVPYMQKVWCKQLDIEYLNFQSSWNNIYNIKIRQMPIVKLAEFNYKILSGTLPCGHVLSKWKSNIPSECVVCHVKEDMRHMLFDCSKVNSIWKNVGNIMHVNLQWKHIVIGYFLDQNNTTKTLNWLCCLMAYSIFKSNNWCKWKDHNYGECDVNKRVANDLRLFMSMQVYFKKKYIPEETIINTIKSLEN